jgi:lipid-A-disaccharide synthase
MLEEHEGVVGFVEVLRHIPSHWRLLNRLKAPLARARGAGDLHRLPRLQHARGRGGRSRGVPVLYYITPQVWAWRAGAIKTMARIITKAAVILPFEESCCAAAGVDATFVGHPLLDRALAMPTKAEARARLGLPAEGDVLALFPGSRAQEIRRHLRDFVEVARELERGAPDCAWC